MDSQQKAKQTIADFIDTIPAQDMPNVLHDLFTPKELEELSERITLLRLLQEGKTQREIAKELGISVTTVSRGARVLKYGSGVIEKYL